MYSSGSRSVSSRIVRPVDRAAPWGPDSVYRLDPMRYRAIVEWFAPGALAMLVMLPRLASPQFGLLDDGLTLQTGRETVGRWASVLGLIPETGRFFPAYWLVYSVVFALVGPRPLAFFAVNVLLFAGLLALLARLVRLGGGSPAQTILTLVLFATCGPAIEAFYTLSKAEPLLLVWIGLSVLAAAASTREAAPARRVALIIASGLALVFAYATKETSAIVLPISLAWLAIERGSRAARPGWGRFAMTYAALNVAAGAVFVVLRWRYAARALGEGTYTRAYALRLETLGPALFRIGAWLIRDFLFLAPLVLIALMTIRAAPADSRRLMLYAGVWMLAWLAVYAPWPATFEYYLLPFAFGASIFGGVVAHDLWRRCRLASSSAARRLAWSALAATALLWLPGIVNAAADARVQLVVDRANAELVDFLARLPRSSRIVLNSTSANEYLSELPLHLAELKRRPDLVVQHVGAAVLSGHTTRDVFVATAMIQQPPGPTVRIAVHEAGVPRDAKRLAEMLGTSGDAVYTTERRARVVEIAMHRLLCPLARAPFVDPTYCPGDRGIFTARTFAYGWRVDRVPEPSAARPRSDIRPERPA